MKLSAPIHLWHDSLIFIINTDPHKQVYTLRGSSRYWQRSSTPLCWLKSKRDWCSFRKWGDPASRPRPKEDSRTSHFCFALLTKASVFLHLCALNWNVLLSLSWSLIYADRYKIYCSVASLPTELPICPNHQCSTRTFWSETTLWRIPCSNCAWLFNLSRKICGSALKLSNTVDLLFWFHM